jgi:hypothetical protein
VHVVLQLGHFALHFLRLFHHPGHIAKCAKSFEHFSLLENISFYLVTRMAVRAQAGDVHRI